MIYYVRHGQTNGNIKKIFVSDDEPLNEKGVRQAKETAENLKDVRLDMIFCSPILRAKQTMEEIAKFHSDVPIIIDKRLAEREHGNLEGLPLGEINVKRWKMSEPLPEGNGETIEEAYKRIENFYNEIFEKYPDKKNLVVSHAGMGKLTLCYFNGFPEDGNLYDYRIKNGEVVVFDKKK